MAQTEHLGLHQWEATDSFLRTDFNEDFAKIDGAVGETLRTHLIRQITTTNQSSQVNVDLTGIDWSAYRSVEIQITGGGTEAVAGTVRINGKSGDDHYKTGGLGGYPEASNMFSGLEVGTNATTLTLDCRTRAVCGTVRYWGQVAGFVVACMTAESGVTLENLSALNLIAYTGKWFTPGMKISIEGMRT